MTRKKASRIGHILPRNCLVKHVIEGKIEGWLQVKGRRKRILDDFKETKGYRKWKEGILDPTLWKTRF